MNISAVFVYGTLKQGEERGHVWPFPPQRVLPARIRGALYDLREYPALVLPGNDWIQGECWCFAISEMPATLKILDEIEEYAGQSDDLYTRIVVTCESTLGKRMPAYTYVYAQPNQLPPDWQLTPNSDGTVSWPRK